MFSAATLFLYIFLATGVDNQQVIRKTPYDLIDPQNRYWVIKANQMVNRPSFSASITFRAPNGTTQYSIDCSTSSQVLYHNDDLIFLTYRNWTVGAIYHIMLDEGVLFSNGSNLSCERQRYSFWPVRVVVPLNG